MNNQENMGLSNNVKNVSDEINDSKEKTSTVLTDDELGEIVDTIKDNISPQISMMRDIHDEVEVLDNKNSNIECSRINTNEDDPYGIQGEEFKTSDVNFFDLDKEYIANIADEEIENHVADSAKQLFDLDNEAIINLLSIVKEYRKDPNYPIWKNMCPKLQGMVKMMALNSPMGLNAAVNYPAIAKNLIQTFIDEAEMDQSFIDLEKTLDEALNIPSVIDLYTEHTHEVMETKIPEMIEALEKEGEFEKANQLTEVKESLINAYNLNLLIDAYNNSTRIRKALRRSYNDYKRYEDDCNYANRKTKFMMNDATQMYTSIYNILDENEFTDDDIKKFIVLTCMSIESYDREDLPQAAYIYYLIKNITILRLTNETKTPFSIELINNIKNVIYMIRDKEAEFNNEHKQLQHKPKRSVRKRSNKK